MDPLPGDVFARLLRRERERVRMSQAELARRIAQHLGVALDPTAITRIEQQTRAVRLDEAVAAAEVLQVPLIVLLSAEALQVNEAEIERHLMELAVAEREWEQARQKVARITRVVQQLSAEEKALHEHTRRTSMNQTDPSASSSAGAPEA